MLNHENDQGEPQHRIRSSNLVVVGHTDRSVACGYNLEQYMSNKQNLLYETWAAGLRRGLNKERGKTLNKNV
jgi:hypothetical protein